MTKRLTIREITDSENKEYQEITTEVECLILSLAKKTCKFLSVKKYSHIEYNAGCEHFFNEIKPYFYKMVTSEPYIYKGQELVQYIYIYRITEELIASIRKAANCFDDYVAPNLPEDLCLYYDYNDLMLFSITHDGFYELYISNVADNLIGDLQNVIYKYFRNKTDDDWHPSNFNVNIFKLK